MRRASLPRVLRRLAVAILVTAAGNSAAEDIDLGFVPDTVHSGLPAGWTEQAMGKAPPVRYALIAEGGAWVLRADSSAAASVLVHPLDLIPDRELRWRWKVAQSVASADLRHKSGDDFAARVYVLFDAPQSELSLTERLGLKLEQALHGAELPSAGLCYVWDNRNPVGTMTPSAYTERVRLMVLETGDAAAGQWRQESRDLAADYRAAFGKSPPRLRGVALMSDTDNTRSRVTAWYTAFRLVAKSGADVSFNQQSPVLP